MFYSKTAFLDMADQILVPPSPTRILEAVTVVQAPPVLLNVPAAANVPAPEGMDQLPL